MKAFFIVVIIFHGLIHIMGFMKAFHLAEMSQLTQPISKPAGILWLLSALLFLSLTIFILTNQAWWWLPALIAVIISQYLIYLSWQDAKFGTIPNLLIFIAVILKWTIWKS